VGPTFANAKDEYLKKPRSRQLLNEVTLSWNFAESVIGNRPLANIKRAEGKAILEVMLTKGWMTATVKYRIAVLSAIFATGILEFYRDMTLTDRLLAERDGILAWAVEGCLEWQREGLNPPQTVLAATEEYFEDEDTVGRWIAEACDQRPSGTELVSMLFNAWKIWAEAAGEHVGSIRGFSQNLASRGFAKWRDPGTTQRGYRGIALKAGSRSTEDMGV
jgi:phage/plasmid-associated DNA primase